MGTAQRTGCRIRLSTAKFACEVQLLQAQGKLQFMLLLLGESSSIIMRIELWLNTDAALVSPGAASLQRV